MQAGHKAKEFVRPAHTCCGKFSSFGRWQRIFPVFFISRNFCVYLATIQNIYRSNLFHRNTIGTYSEHTMSTVQLTVVVITYNEEHNIQSALDSVAFAGEIVLVDGGSTDRTVEIAARYTDKIFRREFDNFSAQKNFGIEQAAHEWVLVLDADETIPEGLGKEIREIVAQGPADAVYSIGRDNYFMGKKLRFSGVQNDRVIRLFPRRIRYRRTRVHETPDTQHLPIRKLRGRILHKTYKDYESMMKKVDHYSTLKALDMYEQGYNPSFIKMLFKPPHRFLRHYIFQGGFLDGKAGFMIASIRALEVFQRITKTWRLQAGETLFCPEQRKN